MPWPGMLMFLILSTHTNKNNNNKDIHNYTVSVGIEP